MENYQEITNQYHDKSVFKYFTEYSQKLEEELYQKKKDYIVVRSENDSNILILISSQQKIVESREVFGFPVYLFTRPFQNIYYILEKNVNEGIAITDYSEEKIKLLSANGYSFKFDLVKKRLFIPLGTGKFKRIDENYIRDYLEYRELGRKMEDFKQQGILVKIADVEFLESSPERQEQMFPRFIKKKYDKSKQPLEQAFYLLLLAKALASYDDIKIETKLLQIFYYDTYEFTEFLRELIDAIKTSKISLDYNDKYLPFRSDLYKHLTPEYITVIKKFLVIDE